MSIEAFWEVIETYNQQTMFIQNILFVFLLLAMILSYRKKIYWLAKVALGIANLFIGVVFYGIYATEPFQKYFALPLYLMCGIMFLYESWKNKGDILEKPNWWQVFLFVLYLGYPLISHMLGNHYPHTVTHIMPCPIVSLSIAVYSGYKHKNKFLLLLLTIWGMTGVKSIFFSAYEDIILLICGLYGIVLLVVKAFRKTK